MRAAIIYMACGVLGYFIGMVRTRGLKCAACSTAEALVAGAVLSCAGVVIKALVEHFYR